MEEQPSSTCFCCGTWGAVGADAGLNAGAKPQVQYVTGRWFACEGLLVYWCEPHKKQTDEVNERRLQKIPSATVDKHEESPI